MLSGSEASGPGGAAGYRRQAPAAIRARPFARLRVTEGREIRSTKSEMRNNGEPRIPKSETRESIFRELRGRLSPTGAGRHSGEILRQAQDDGGKSDAGASKTWRPDAGASGRDRGPGALRSLPVWRFGIGDCFVLRAPDFGRLCGCGACAPSRSRCEMSAVGAHVKRARVDGCQTIIHSSTHPTIPSAERG